MKLKYLFLSVIMSLACLGASAQVPTTVEIGLLSTTHIVFTSDLTYVDISSPEVIVAKVVDASKNMLAIKARTVFDYTTTVSALETNGTMHTFYVRYKESPTFLVVDTRRTAGSVVAQVNTQIRPDPERTYDDHGNQKPAGGPAPADQYVRPGAGMPSTTPSAPAGLLNITTDETSNFGRANAPTLEEVVRIDRGLYHVTDKCYKLEASCVNVFAYSDLTYVVLTLKNKSDIGYEAGDAQFTIENQRHNAKSLSTDKSIWPKSSYGTLSCAPGTETIIGYTIPKLTLQKNEVLKIYIYEKGGNRNMFLTLDDKDINYAISPISQAGK